ncbi:MAG: alpha-glucan family phosphorylase [Vicinamibacterales bacterium]
MSEHNGNQFDCYLGFSLPERIRQLNQLAYDLWWVWHDEARNVFRDLDYTLWRQTSHNPVKMLRLMARDRLERAATDPEFLARYDRAVAKLDEARKAQDTWWTRRGRQPDGDPIAYFSAEFALHQSLPIYAGGLGVLAGDHCKEANDIGLPLVGIGFMYPQGYFHQSISSDGWQQEIYERLDWLDAPIEPAVTPDGKNCVTGVPLGDRTVLVSVWIVRMGGVKLYLLDTDLEENAPWDRELSARLYGGDRETRVQQEIVLGVAGVRALKALGIKPRIWHLNEGHAGFVILQRLRDMVEGGLAFSQALDEVRRTTVFTTHTPVPAGHDAFSFGTLEAHLAGMWGSMGQSRADFLALGRHDSGFGTMFNMTALALRSAGAVNAVSQLHGKVTREMWGDIWPNVPAAARPVDAVTNGIHVPSWVARDLSALFDRYLGADWRARHDDQALWDRILEIPDDELWRVRRSLRTYLFEFIRERSRERWTHGNVTAARVIAAGVLLDPNALTIGFARRFATYKRSALIFHDPDRLARILNAVERPVQLVFAGKAHPADDQGKHVLQGVFQRAVDPRFSGRIALLEDYDLHVAHYLVQGCDVWLNTPRKPMEASGTSGMKASVNGVPNLSIGDGWWAEGYTGTNGWLIDPGPVTGAESDAADADALYRLLEDQVVPLFYERENGIPRRWLTLVREAIRTVGARFSTRRMLKEYVERLYERYPPIG